MVVARKPSSSVSQNKRRGVWVPAFGGTTGIDEVECGWAKRSVPTTQIEAADRWWARRKSAFAHPTKPQSNKLDTDSSAAVRAMASAISGAIGSVRMFLALRTASVGRIESVMTSSLSLEDVIRAAAPPDSTPWLI